MGPLCSFWSILTVHVGGLVNLVYKLAPATRVNLPSLYHGLAFSPWEFGWGGGGGKVLHATETAISSTRLSLGAYA